jgi:hypothetical protein
MRRTIENRLRRLEGTAPQVPSCVFSSCPLAEGEADTLLANWQSEVEAGHATVMGQALMLHGRKLSRAEWLTKWGYA